MHIEKSFLLLMRSLAMAALCGAVLSCGSAWAAKGNGVQPGTAQLPVAQTDPEVLRKLEELEKSKRDFEKYVEVEQVRRDLSKDYQDKLINNISGQVDRFGLLLTDFGIVLTILAVAAGLFIYSKASQDARDEAKKWLDDNVDEIKAKLLNDIREQSNEIINASRVKCMEILDGVEMDAREDARTRMDDVHSSVSRRFDELYDGLSKSVGEKFSDNFKFEIHAEVDEEAEKALNETSYILKNIPEAKYTAEQLFARGLTEYHAGNKESAAVYFGKAAEAKDANAGLMAEALVNKCVSLGELGRYEDAVLACDEVIFHFGGTSVLELQEWVAMALNNKSVAFNRLGKSDEELKMLNDVIVRFGESEELCLRNQVAKAKNGRGFESLCRAKSCLHDVKVGTMLLEVALHDFNNAVHDIVNKPIALGNQGYSLFLLNRRDEAREPLKQALKDGGEQLYKYEMDDSYIHPVPEDEDFRKLLAELWREVHNTEPPQYEPKADGTTPPPASS